jgi:hypothetical protein
LHEQLDELKDKREAVLHLVLDAGKAVFDVFFQLLLVLQLEEGTDVIDNEHVAVFPFKNDVLRPNLYHEAVAVRTQRHGT